MFLLAAWAFSAEPTKLLDVPGFVSGVLSADGTRAAYRGMQPLPPNGTFRAYVGVTGFPRRDDFNEVYEIVFSDDGKHIAYVARKGSDLSLVIDGKEVGPV